MTSHDKSEGIGYRRFIEGLGFRELSAPPQPERAQDRPDSISMNLLNFAGQTVLITGGASGIGAATARALLRLGACVIIADVSANEGNKLLSAEADAVEDSKLHFVETDVRNPSLCRDAVNTCISKTGRVDLLITSAGIVIPDQHPLNHEDFQRIMNVNVWGTMCMIDAVKDHFMAQRRGTIVTVGSIVAAHGWPDRAMYCASKAAVEAATRAYALELSQWGIKVNGVAPGLTWTPLMEKVVRAAADSAKAYRFRSVQQASGEMFTPEQIANYILFLASPLSDGLCGAILDASGGRLAGHVPDLSNPGPRYDYDFERSLTGGSAREP
jgi:NAD(P)-dependent dehydrogenase (short-subunit alcohol dehydrogenase family)